MITKFYIENFRSIEKAEIELGKITVLTGANSSGKTSIIYAMMVLKNFLSNPNQSIDNLLVPAQTNLGGFKEAVFKKDESRRIKLGYEINLTHKNGTPFRGGYQLELGNTGCSLTLFSHLPYSFELKMNISLPYPLNKEETVTINVEDVPIEVIWDGKKAISISLSKNKDIFTNPNKNLSEKALAAIADSIILATNAFSFVDYIPLKRGFTKPFFNTIPLTAQQYTEDEIATLLATNRDLEGKVSSYMERFVNKTFSVRSTPGTSNFYLQVRDRKTGFITDLVNEGLGLNQLVTILAKILMQDQTIGLLCIDEPEIHLHPSYIDKLIQIIIETSGTRIFNQFILSSHNEHLLSSLLNQVAVGEINKNDVKIYYLTKDGMGTSFELQPVNEKGQIEGGLKSFYESELNLTKEFFKAND